MSRKTIRRHAAAGLTALVALPKHGHAVDDTCWWQGPRAMACYFLIYTEDRVKPEDVPRVWIDLLDPKWKAAW
jgi:hypothetical protein